MKFKRGELVRGGPEGHWLAEVVQGGNKFGYVRVVWKSGVLAGREALVASGLEKLPKSWREGVLS